MTPHPLRYYDDAEIRLSMVVLLILDAAMFLLVFNDLTLTHNPTLMFALVTARCSMFLGGVVFAVVTLRHPHTKWYVPLMTMATALLLVVYTLASVTRPTTRMISALSPLIAVACFYFLLPGVLTFRWSVAIALSLSEVCLTLFWRQGDFNTKISIVAGYLTVNSIGLVSSALRQRTKIAKGEAEVRDRLSVLEAMLKAADLSPREVEVAKGLVEGQTRFGIATALNISEETVKSHTTSVYRKLGVNSRLELFQKLHSPQEIESVTPAGDVSPRKNHPRG